MTAFEVVDRYSATGTPYPHPLTVCNGPCEGMGIYPVYVANHDARRGQEGYVFPSDHTLTKYERCAVAEKCARDGVEDDGWYFIGCPDCSASPLERGTGRIRSRRESLRRVPRWLYSKAQFIRYGLTHRPPHFGWWANTRMVLGIAFRR